MDERSITRSAPEILATSPRKNVSSGGLVSDGSGPRADVTQQAIVEELKDAVYETRNASLQFVPLTLNYPPNSIDGFVQNLMSTLQNDSNYQFTPKLERANYARYRKLLQHIVDHHPFNDRLDSKLVFYCNENAVLDANSNVNHASLKPDGSGTYFSASELSKRPQSLKRWSDIDIVLEVKHGNKWRNAFSQAGTYARSLFEASGRWLVIVLFFDHTLAEHRILSYTHMGAFHTPALKLATNADDCRLFVLSLWALAEGRRGIDRFCHTSGGYFYYALPDRAAGGLSWWRVTETLYQRIAIWGRATHVFRVERVLLDDEATQRPNTVGDESKPEAITFGTRHSSRTRIPAPPRAAPASLLSQSSSGLRHLFPPQTSQPSSPQSLSNKGLSSPTQLFLGKETDAFAVRCPPVDRRYQDEEWRRHDQAVLRLSPKFPAGQEIDVPTGTRQLILKSSFLPIERLQAETDFFAALKGQHGFPDVIGGYTSETDDPKAIDFSNLKMSDISGKAANETPSPEDLARRVRQERRVVNLTEGATLVNCNVMDIIYAAVDGLIGILNAYCAGWLHRDPSIGNLLILKKAIMRSPQQFENNTCLNEKYGGRFDFIKRHLSHQRGCLMDGDMAKRMSDMTTQDARSGTLPFVAHRLLNSNEPGIHSVLDDAMAIVWVTFWALVHSSEQKTQAEQTWIEQLCDLTPRIVSECKISISARLRLGIEEKEVSSPLALAEPLFKEWFEIQAKLIGTLSEIAERFSRNESSHNDAEGLDKLSLEYMGRFIDEGIKFLNGNKVYETYPEQSN